MVLFQLSAHGFKVIAISLSVCLTNNIVRLSCGHRIFGVFKWKSFWYIHKFFSHTNIKLSCELTKVNE